MQLAKTRETTLKAFEHGLSDTAEGAFIGSFSLATVQLLFTSIASDVVPVSRRDEIEERFLLAEADALLPNAWARACLSIHKRTSLPTVMEWRCSGLPSLFTLTSGWHYGEPLRSSPEQSLACSVAGYRLCDPTQSRIWNGVMYRKAYRGWRPVRPKQRTGLPGLPSHPRFCVGHRSRIEHRLDFIPLGAGADRTQVRSPN